MSEKLRKGGEGCERVEKKVTSTGKREKGTETNIPYAPWCGLSPSATYRFHLLPQWSSAAVALSAVKAQPVRREESHELGLRVAYFKEALCSHLCIWPWTITAGRCRLLALLEMEIMCWHWTGSQSFSLGQDIQLPQQRQQQKHPPTRLPSWCRF